ncbi:hypothetical protein U6G28_02700 [Actinomycetaceae bacterium MB13-C1-2]|nr:hypothetical protein U6G28_02700 [Actinomycetaceae bacterium MB13-C1-2]
MAQYGIDSEAQTLIDAGWTEDQIIALAPNQNIQHQSFGWIAWNRDAVYAIENAASRVTEPKKEASAPRPVSPATDRQIAYIRTLIRKGAGSEGGFMRVPADADLVKLSKREASALIDSLTGNY